jgi:hypothetical protein
MANRDAKRLQNENFDISEGWKSDMPQLQESQTGKILQYKTIQQFTSGPIPAVGRINQPTNRASTTLIDKLSNRLPDPQKQNSVSPAVQFVWVAEETGQQKPGLYQTKSPGPVTNAQPKHSDDFSIRHSRWIQPIGKATTASTHNKKEPEL